MEDTRIRMLLAIAIWRCWVMCASVEMFLMHANSMWPEISSVPQTTRQEGEVGGEGWGAVRGEWWGEGWQEAPGGRGKRGRVRKVCGEGCGEEHNHLYNPAGVRHWRVSLPPVMGFDASTS